jgi:UDP-glucose 4-epimerase
MKIVVTGVSGYIGHLLAERLLAEGVGEIVGIDLAPSPLALRFVRRDVRDPAIVRDFAGADVVAHLAFVVEPTRDLRVAYDINLGGSRNVLAACEAAGVPALVVASSVAAYGVQGDRVITESTPLFGDRRSYYAHTKRLVEEELDLFEARNPAVRVARLRPALLAGPRLNPWARSALSLLGGIDTRRGMHLPVIHEQDVVDAFVRAITQPVRGRFLIAHRHSPSMREIARAAGKQPLIVPERVLLGIGDLAAAFGRSGLSREWLSLTIENRFRFDPSATERALGWAATRQPMAALDAARRTA